MTRKRVFISYDYANDKRYKCLLTEWDSLNRFDFIFYDRPKNTKTGSFEAGRIKETVTGKINSAKYVLCIIGARAFESPWVEWEIKKALASKKKVVAVKTDRLNIKPEILDDPRVIWAYSFSFDSIAKLISNA